MKALKTLLFLLLTIGIPSCVSFAPPPPLLTFGGPQTTKKGMSETAIGLGTGAALFEEGHAGAQGWFGRFKYGLNDKFDIGLDAMGAKRNEGLYLALKAATRYQLNENSRLELGIGVADESSGKSLNADFAYTIGTLKDKTWNFYSSFRVAYAKGVAGNFIVLPGQMKGNDSIPPPNTFFALVNLGAQAEINPQQKFIFEGGYGYIFPEGSSSGPAFYLSTGILFNFGKTTSSSRKQ